VTAPAPPDEAGEEAAVRTQPARPGRTAAASRQPGVSAVTIDDVAVRAAVSVATVSRALRDLPNVAPSTRERVLAAARELHYVADPSAARLASGRNLAVGLVVPMLGAWYYATAFSGAESVLTVAGYDLLPYTTSGPGGRDGFRERLPFRKRVDGLIAVDSPLLGDHLERLAADGLVVVTIGSRTDAASSLEVENTSAARLAVNHLLGLGHRRIGLIGGLDDEPYGFDAPQERRRGYDEALRAADLVPDPALVVPGNFSLEGGAEAMHRLLHLGVPPTAVFAMSDEMAIGAAQVARDAGLRIPEDLSIIGFDDHDVAAYVGLTTVRQDVLRTGERAAALLLEHLGGTRPDVVHETIPTRLVVRRSTGPPPRGRSTQS
jgi:LacI family transcriptional regulator, repressor for deo operon, udp, cdd, tsx, nupC, and nupG